MADFELVPSKDLFWLDVVYAGEETPRYMINMLAKSCTCTGHSIIQKCKHMKEYLEKLKEASKKFAAEMESQNLE